MPALHGRIETGALALEEQANGLADGDSDSGERVGDREHEQVVPAQSSAPRHPPAITSAAGGTPKTMIRTLRSDVSVSIGIDSEVPRTSTSLI